MSLWKQKVDLLALNQWSKNTLIEHLGIEYTAFDSTSLSATMPVHAQTHQPMGMLHGGASVVLAETVGSAAANLCVDSEFACVGLDINANHLKSKRSGVLTASAKAVHLGRRTHVWQIDIVDESQQLICVSRLTMAVIDNPMKA